MVTPAASGVKCTRSTQRASEPAHLTQLLRVTLTREHRRFLCSAGEEAYKRTRVAASARSLSRKCYFGDTAVFCAAALRSRSFYRQQMCRNAGSAAAAYPLWLPP